MSRRIFLAGASGAIGRRLCPLLIADGWQVTGTTRNPEKAAALRAMRVEPSIVDVFDAVALHDAVVAAQPDIVIHQLTDLPPALEPSKMEEASVRNARVREIGTQNLVAAAIAAGAKRLIAQSICFVYAPGVMPYLEDAPLNLDAPGNSGVGVKAVASLEHQVLHAPFEGIVLRFGKLYGPGTGFDLPPPGSPVHVDAAADATRRALTQGTPGLYNVAEDDGTVNIQRTITELGWRADFRIEAS